MPKPLHLFRAGTYTDLHGRRIAISPEELAASAAAYDPDLSSAPLVVGHPQTNSPAFGWISSLAATGADLTGEPIQIDPAFAAAVAAGRYKTRSASFWPPEHPDNPVPGTWYLRHVGFLGAAAPAVKGLRGADLSAAETVVVVEFDSFPAVDQNLGGSMADSAKDPVAELAAREGALAKRAAEIDRQAQQIATRDAALKAKEEDARRGEIRNFAERLAAEARIRPADASPLVALLAGLPAAPAVEFAAAEDSAHTARPAGAWLREWLAALPPLVELGEVATGARAAEGSSRPAEFAAPPGYRVDPQALALHRNAKQYQTLHPQVSYADAVAAVR